MSRPFLEISRVGALHESALSRFFENLQARGVGRFFHPHPLTAESAARVASYAGDDLYFVLLEDGKVLGYAMLRGWDEGYSIPSLGLVVDPDSHGQGMGRLLMEFLHVAALRRGAEKIRLRVFPDNLAAVSLYRSLGYELTPDPDGPQLVGFLNLRRR